MIEERIRGGKEILVYSIAKPEDVEEAAEFAVENFYNSSPIRELTSFDDLSDEVGLLAWRKGRFQKCFAHPTSIIIREKSTGAIVGFSAHHLQVKDDPASSANTSGVNWVSSNPRSPGWLNRALTDELNRGMDLFDRYKTDRIMHYWFGAVRKDYRGQTVIGSSPSYWALNAEIALANKVGACRGTAFNNYAARDKNWETIRSIDFKDFQLPDGSRPLAGVDLGIHRTARLIAIRASSLILHLFKR